MHSISPIVMVASFWRNRALIYALTKREITGRYRGSYFGILWSFINPIFMLLVYTIFFGRILQVKWGLGEDSNAQFGLILFAGLIMFNFFSESLNRAPTLILNNPNFVKKVVFPIEILPWVCVGTALFHLLISLIAWFLGYLFLVGVPQSTFLLALVIMIPPLFLIMGFSWLLASLGVYFRDISQLIGPLMTALMFLSPVFFSLSTLPENFRLLVSMSPITPAIVQFREVLFFGTTPTIFSFGIYLLISLVIAWLGFAWFQKTRKGFADVI